MGRVLFSRRPLTEHGPRYSIFVAHKSLKFSFRRKSTAWNFHPFFDPLKNHRLPLPKRKLQSSTHCPAPPFFDPLKNHRLLLPKRKLQSSTHCPAPPFFDPLKNQRLPLPKRKLQSSTHCRNPHSSTLSKISGFLSLNESSSRRRPTAESSSRRPPTLTWTPSRRPSLSLLGS